jgi:hypothetical protein
MKEKREEWGGKRRSRERKGMELNGQGGTEK